MKSLQELRQIQTHERAVEFNMWARALLRQKHGAVNYLATREGQRLPDRVQRLVKDAVSATTAGEQGFSNDNEVVSAGFIASLVGRSVFDTLTPAMRRVPFDLPGVRIASSVQGYTVPEAGAKPLTKLQVDPGQLVPYKASSIVVVTDGLADDLSSAASNLINQELRSAVINAVDGNFLSVLASGVSPTAASGSPGGDPLADLDALLAALETDAQSTIFVVVPNAQMKRLAMRGTSSGALAFPGLTVNGGNVAGVTFLASDNLPAVGSPAVPLTMAIDATGVAVADRGVALDSASHATLEMSDAPVGGEAAAQTSLWQSNSRALRAERHYRLLRLRESAVATMSTAW